METLEAIRDVMPLINTTLITILLISLARLSSRVGYIEKVAHKREAEMDAEHPEQKDESP